MRHLTALKASARPTSGRTTLLTSPMRRAASSVMVPAPEASVIRRARRRAQLHGELLSALQLLVGQRRHGNRAGRLPRLEA